MVNLNALQNTSPMDLNMSIVTNNNVLEEAPVLFATNVPYWLFPVIFILFIVMVWFIYKKLDWGLDIIQSSLFAALINVLLSYSIIKIGWSVSLVPLAMWGVIWTTLLVIMFYIKSK